MLLHGASDLHQKGPKRVIPSKGVPFAGLDDLPLNLGIQPTKSEILGPLNGTFKREQQLQILLTSTLLCRSWRNFHMGQPPWMGLRVWSHDFTQQIQDCGRRSYWIFRKMLISAYWMKIIAQHTIWCKLGTQMQHGANHGQRYMTAFSLQCSRERSDDYNF